MTSPNNDKRHLLARDILLTAEEFRRSAMVLESHQPVNQGIDPHLMMPMTVSYAFAGEMYLKFLYCVRTTRDIPSIHNLNDIFNKHLPKDIRPIIKRHWENPLAIEAQIRARMNQHLGRQPLTFEQTLERSADAFVKFRYHYESKAIMEFSGDLVSAFRATIFELYPTEYADVRLPLPPGVLSADMQNVVSHGVRPPANLPDS